MILLLYFLINKKPILSAIFLSIQFYMAVYLGIFSFFLTGIYYGIYFLFNLKELKKIVIDGLIIGSIFFILTYPFLIKKYLDFQKTYHQVRDMNEIIANSGNITDYLYFLPRTFFSTLKPIEKYNSNVRFTSERMSFPGFIILIGAILGIATYKIKKKPFNWFYFLSLIGVGFVCYKVLFEII